MVLEYVLDSLLEILNAIESQVTEEMCVLQSVGSVVPGLEPLGIDLMAVSFYLWISTYYGSCCCPSYYGNL